MAHDDVLRQTLRDRRDAVLARLGGGILILPAALEHRRNGDAEYPFRQESDLLYLSGFPEAEAVLVLAPNAAKKFTLFVRPRNKDEEVWTGRRAGVEGAKGAFGADQAFTIDQLDAELPKLLLGAHTVHAPWGVDPAWDTRVIGIVEKLRAKTRTGAVVPDRYAALGPVLHELRLYKDAVELGRLRRAAELTVKGHARGIAATRPGLHEYEIEAEIAYEFRRGGGINGYDPIVAAGVNATILHYRTGTDRLDDGALVLVDMGCEVDGYTADVTRTWPVGKDFSAPQRTLYDLVLEAHEAAIAAVRPGATRDGVHEIAARVLIRGLRKLGFVTGDEDAIWKDKSDKSYRRYFMHGTSHWLGLDVHDAGSYHQGGASRTLAPGMVLTVEPGLYVQPDDDRTPIEYRGIGIRIEDDVLVTSTGREVLTEALPRTAEDIRRLRAGS